MRRGRLRPAVRLRLAHVPFWDSTKYGFRSEQFGVIERCPQSDSAFSVVVNALGGTYVAKRCRYKGIPLN